MEPPRRVGMEPPATATPSSFASRERSARLSPSSGSAKSARKRRGKKPTFQVSGSTTSSAPASAARRIKRSAVFRFSAASHGTVFICTSPTRSVRSAFGNSTAAPPLHPQRACAGRSLLDSVYHRGFLPVNTSAGGKPSAKGITEKRETEFTAAAQADRSNFQSF